MNVLNRMEEIQKSIIEIRELMEVKTEHMEENEPENPTEERYDKIESYFSLSEDLKEVEKQIRSINSDMRMHQIDYGGLKKFRL